jgi:hypothetical protein
MEKPQYEESDEDIIREITEFKGDYLPLDKDRLVLFAVSFLESRKIEPTFDKTVVTTFRLFPRKFALLGFPEYPDGKTIYYCVYNHCTLTKKWLVGNVQSGFKITERGRFFLDETSKMLEGKIKTTKAHGIIPRRKEATFIAIVKRTSAYKKYLSGRKEEITKFDILDALRLTRDSEESLTEIYLKRYLEYANRLNDTNVIQFLEFSKTKLGGDRNT